MECTKRNNIPKNKTLFFFVRYMCALYTHCSLMCDPKICNIYIHIIDMKIRQHIHTRKPVHVQMRAAYMPVKKTTIHTILYTILKKPIQKRFRKNHAKIFSPNYCYINMLYLTISFCHPQTTHDNRNPQNPHAFRSYKKCKYYQLQVLKILAWDTVNHLVYYLGTQDKKPGQVHLYTVKDPHNDHAQRFE